MGNLNIFDVLRHDYMERELAFGISTKTKQLTVEG